MSEAKSKTTQRKCSKCDLSNKHVTECDFEGCDTIYCSDCLSKDNELIFTYNFEKTVSHTLCHKRKKWCVISRINSENTLRCINNYADWGDSILNNFVIKPKKILRKLCKNCTCGKIKKYKFGYNKNIKTKWMCYLCSYEITKTDDNEGIRVSQHTLHGKRTFIVDEHKPTLEKLALDQLHNYDNMIYNFTTSSVEQYLIPDLTNIVLEYVNVS